MAWLSACSDSNPAKPAKPAGDAGTVSPVTQPAVWTMMGFDARNNYHQENEKLIGVDNATSLVEKWRFKIAGFPPGSPVVAEGKVFAMATGGTYAIDLATGVGVWEALHVAGTASLAYAKGVIYAHSADANLWALNASDGSVLWGPVPTNPQPRCDGTSSPIVADEKVLVGHSCGLIEVTAGPDQDTARGGVEAFHAQDGGPLWTYWTVPESGENGAMVWSTVSVDIEARLVFASTGNNYTLAGGSSDAIHAIDLDTGERRWLQQVRSNDVWTLGGTSTTTGEDTDFGANPILADVGGRKILAAGDKGSEFWALDRETGQILWSHPNLSATHSPGYGGVLNSGAFDGKYFYVASNEPPMGAQLHVIDPADGSDVVDPQRLDAIVWGPLSLANGLLFVPVNSVLQIHNAETLELLTSFDTGGTIAAGAAAIADGNVIVKSGLQYVFAPDALPNDAIICYGLGTKGTADGSPSASAGQPTWSAVYKDIIVGTGCAGSALCHGGDVGHLQMKDSDSTYNALVEVKAMGTNLTPGNGPDCAESGLIRVVPGAPDDSLLVKKLENAQPCGTAMPPVGMLTADQIAQVRMWIANGANKD